MKKIAVFVACFTLAINSFSQKLIKTYWDYYKTKLQAEYYTDAYGVKNGSFKGYSEYGGILMQGTFKDGSPIGKWIENYKNGKLHFIKFYETPGYDNLEIENGKQITYYEDGITIMGERNLKNGELDGVFKDYNENGILILEGEYVNGVFERTGESKRIYDEEQEKKKKQIAEQEAAILLKNTEAYNKIIPEADKAYEAKDYNKAVQLYKSASELLVNENYPKDKISEMIEKCNTEYNFFNDYIRLQNDTLINDFKTLKANFKIKSIKEFSSKSYQYYEKLPERASNYCDCLEPWNHYDLERNLEYWNRIDRTTNEHLDKHYYASKALKCFEKNKEFYEPYQRAITEAFYKYDEALTNEETNIKKSGGNFYYGNKNIQFCNYDKSAFLNNLKVAKDNYEISKTVKTSYSKALENKLNITNLIEENKKKTLFKKYLIVYEEISNKINAYPGLGEVISLLNSLNSFSDKVIGLCSQETKEIEKKLKDAKTSEQIQAIILGQ
jgi:hypothetical protein